MKNYRPLLSFGSETASAYEDTPRGDEAETVEFLASKVRSGRVLELAVGTGRIALPLAERGFTVSGIDFSPDMLAKLREKDGDGRINATLGDFADVPVEGVFGLIYIVFNTFHNLLTQDEQVRCVANVAKHLDDTGVFVVEAGLPSEHFGKDVREYVNIDSIDLDRIGFDVAQYDGATQCLTENHVVLSTEGIQLFPIVTRYVWPSELDLMARLAGLRLLERWSGWKGEPFTRESHRHVSVYGY